VHVLVTADTLGGVWTYTRELVCGLIAHGHQVTLVSFGKIPDAAQAFWLDRKNLTYYPTTFPLEWMQDAASGIIQSARYLETIIDQCQPDLLHFNQFCYGALECGIPKIVVAHSDVRSWWSAVHDSHPPSSPWMDWYTQLVSRGLRCADLVVAPSLWMLNAICDNYERPEYTRVIYNARSVDLFHPSTAKNDSVLSVGRIWDKAKQITLLLERDQSIPVRIAGPALHPEATGAMQIDCRTNLKFYGEQNEAQLCALYSDSATYAATSRYEPFGLAPLEAALSRCALIANDIPVFHELWGDSAFYFRRNDPDGLATAICILSQDTPLRHHHADQAYRHARIRFDSRRMVKEYENLYLNLIGGRANA